MDKKRWLVLSKEDISPSKWFPLERHRVQLPNGTIVEDYYLSPIGEVVIVLALTTNYHVVLVEQYKHGLGQIMIELPAGMRQKERTLLQSAVNELEEETGIKVDESVLSLMGKVANSPTKTNQITYGYILFNAEFNSSQRLDPTEDIRVLTYPAPKVLEMVLQGEIWAADSATFILQAAFRYPDIFHPTNPHQ